MADAGTCTTGGVGQMAMSPKFRRMYIMSSHRSVIFRVIDEAPKTLPHANSMTTKFYVMLGQGNRCTWIRD